MRNLNLDHVDTFAQVIELGSFSATADRLNLTQPAVSLQIRQLEKKLGVRLIERVGKRATPTPAGAELLLHARRISTTAIDAPSNSRLADISRCATIPSMSRLPAR